MMLENRTEEAPGTIFGSDGAGSVTAIGPDARTDIAVGDSVVISPSLYWGPDERIPGPDYEILGSPTHGTHAEYVAVPAANVHLKPAHLSWEQAAALPLAGVTAWRALITRGRLKQGETVVIGAASSGVGTLSIQIAAAIGARVVAITSSPDKAQEALALGATTAVDRTSPTFVDDLSRATNRRADLALDPTGAFWQQFADTMRPAGRLVVVGKMASPVGELRVQSIYSKQLDVLGSSMGSPSDFAFLLDHVTVHGWQPHRRLRLPARANHRRLHPPRRTRPGRQGRSRRRIAHTGHGTASAPTNHPRVWKQPVAVRTSAVPGADTRCRREACSSKK